MTADGAVEVKREPRSRGTAVAVCVLQLASKNQRNKMIRKTVLFLLAAVAQRPVQAFVPVSPRLKTTGLERAPPSTTTAQHKTTLVYFNNNNDNNDPDWITRRIQRADLLGIRRDAVLTACYVLCRFLIYDLATGAKDVPEWDLQDVLYLMGTSSSAIVLVTYWTIAGLLTQSFENMTSTTRSDSRQCRTLLSNLAGHRTLVSIRTS